jgi:hypothetical protein
MTHSRLTPDQIRGAFAELQPHFVTLAEVSRALEVPVWEAQRHRLLPDFPKPIYQVGKMTLYIDTELVAFYRKLNAAPKPEKVLSMDERRRMARLKTLYEGDPLDDN